LRSVKASPVASTGDLVFTKCVLAFTVAIGAANFYREVFGFFVAAKRRKKRGRGKCGGAADGTLMRH
jgi:hypothetical protein